MWRLVDRTSASEPGEHTTEIRGTAEGETLIGTEQADTISAGGGNDVVRGLGGPDKIEAGKGKDRLYGGSGDDSIDAQDPPIWKPTGRDLIYCAPGHDTVEMNALDEELPQGCELMGAGMP